ncbi:hypothetical protein WJX72_005616 [[Myrmecia] bisecta]|uniref:Coenzyme Q-binding protein COQ10 START domain-containing protein n=1 Tax=[Myrmecia] bisecta TaxID=41462 RepID=A0AAW1PNG3_9CHLO
MCKVSLRAKVDLPPDRVFDILTNPDNARVFRGIKRITYRKVLERDAQGRQKVEVEHEAAWKFLCFSGSFRTRLFCWQDPRAGTIRFKLARPGMMKNFEGLWVVQPFVPSLTVKRDGSKTASTSGQSPSGPLWFDPAQALSNLQHKFGEHKMTASLITLEQSVLPAMVPPPPLDRIIKGIAAKQVRLIMDDLRTEVKRINAQSKGKGSRKDSEEELQRQSASKMCKMPQQQVASIGLGAYRGTWGRLDVHPGARQRW